jgi:hypothetical protein
VGWDRSIPRITEWVAVLGVAGSVEQLDGLAADLLDQVPDHGLFGTVDAHEGLAERLRVPPGTWISGVAAETRREIDQALARIGRTGPVVIGEFRVVRLAE